jgi:hypothetical protein
VVVVDYYIYKFDFIETALSQLKVIISLNAVAKSVCYSQVKLVTVFKLLGSLEMYGRVILASVISNDMI